ncbi:MAG: IclR family transcriptional regulator [Thalassobaculum sp.]|uniref:IclR family transcriptional regulator n=1 Tax=Thalassobaculum sp. TaxID=2022740 RepID=UPI0032EB4B9F
MPASSMKSLHKAIAVLDCFSRTEPSLTLGSIAARLALPKPTAHRLLAALREAGLIVQDGSRDRYRLGLKLVALGGVVLSDLALFHVARPYAERLANQSGEAAHLCAFDGFNVMSIDRREMQPGRNEQVIIEREPPHCTSTGKAILAFQPEQVVARVVAAGLPRFTAGTITDPQALRAELAEVRDRGYALDLEERQVGIRCVGAPIRDPAGAVVGSISATGPADRFPDGRLPAIAELVTGTARAISNALAARAG